MAFRNATMGSGSPPSAIMITGSSCRGIGSAIGMGGGGGAGGSTTSKGCGSTSSKRGLTIVTSSSSDDASVR